LRCAHRRQLTRDALCASSFIPQEWRHPRGLPIDLNMDWWGKLAKDWATDSLSSHAHGDHTQGLKKDVPGAIPLAPPGCPSASVC